MINKKERNDTFLTIFSKGTILLINLVITSCIMYFWGAEGKGFQAIFTINLAIIIIVTNIFNNSSISYYVSKVGASKLYAQACIWTFISASICVFIFYIIGNSYFLILLLITSILAGFLSFHNALYIGMQKIKYFNLLTILQPFFVLVFMFILYKTTNSTYVDYFYAYILSLIVVISIAFFLTKKTVGKLKLQIDFSITKQSFNYGFQNELSNFFHLLSMRASAYFILYYLSAASLGVFVVGMSIAESIWIFSKSISMVQYSKIIQEGNTQNARKGVITASVFSIVISLVCIIIILLIPNALFTLAFTNEFLEGKKIVLLMSPGILFLAFSTVYGHYFAAIGKMKVLVLKSVVGAILTVVLSIIIIPVWEINGVCVITSIVSFVSSAIIIGYFILMKDKGKYLIHKTVDYD